MKSRQIFFFFLALLVMILLAYSLHGVVNSLVIIPLAKFLWLIKGYIGTFPQDKYWVLALGFGVFIFLLSIPLEYRQRRLRRLQTKTASGPVEDLSLWLTPFNQGVFEQWHIAHLLGELALHLFDRQAERESHTARLLGPDWNPPENVGRYLEAGLKTHYTEYARRRRGIQAPMPLDMDVETVVDYLESLLEDKNDHHS